MDWGKVAETTIGTVTGGAIALASMWIKELIDRRKAAQVWFEQYYITEGIDKLLSHVRMMNLQIVSLRSGWAVATRNRTKELYPGMERPLKSEAHEAYPHEALVRLENLIDDRMITALISSYTGRWDFYHTIPPGSRSEIFLTASLDLHDNLYRQLRTIRTELLKVEIKQKSDIKDIPNRSGIKQALSELSKAHDQWQANLTERDQLLVEEK